MAGLRLVHIVLASLWVGFNVLFGVALEPLLRRLPPRAFLAVTGVMFPITGIVLTLLALLVIGTGLGIVHLSGGHAALLESNSGRAQLLALIASVLAAVNGSALQAPLMSRQKAAAGVLISGPDPVATDQLTALGARMALLAKANLVLVLLATAAMAVQRVL